jgi:hypothetical protein
MRRFPTNLLKPDWGGTGEGRPFSREWSTRHIRGAVDDGDERPASRVTIELHVWYDRAEPAHHGYGRECSYL